MRAQVIAARRTLGSARRDRAAALVTATALDLPVVAAARCAAAYWSIGTEPGTSELLAQLRSRGVRVLLPVLRDDLDLDWAIYDAPVNMVQPGGGLWTPTGDRLGVDGVRAADVVIAPALAVDPHGRRLGRGGGSYDRALARVPADRVVITLLYDGEVLPTLPTEAHDQAVDLAVLPSGVARFAGRDRSSPARTTPPPP